MDEQKIDLGALTVGVRKLRPGPGDVVVVRHPGTLPPDQLADMSRTLSAFAQQAGCTFLLLPLPWAVEEAPELKVSDFASLEQSMRQRAAMCVDAEHLAGYTRLCPKCRRHLGGPPPAENRPCYYGDEAQCPHCRPEPEADEPTEIVVRPSEQP